jgi:hypothetical protein
MYSTTTHVRVTNPKTYDLFRFCIPQDAITRSENGCSAAGCESKLVVHAIYPPINLGIYASAVI